MPTTIPVAAFIVGAVLVVIAIMGGNLEMFGIKTSGSIKKGTRLVGGLVGLGFIGLALGLSLFPLPLQLPPTTVVASGATVTVTTTAVAQTAASPTAVTPTAASPQAVTPTNPATLPAVTSCSTAIGSHLQEAKPKIAPSACPKNKELPVDNYAIQQFEHGWMLEPSVESHTVYVLFELSKKTWKSFQENWQAQGGPPDSCKNIPEKPGNYKKPIYSFGQVWCGSGPSGGLSSDDRQALGYGNYAGFGNPPLLYYQELDDNTMMFGGAPLAVNQYVSNVSGTVIFILFGDNRWDMVGALP